MLRDGRYLFIDYDGGNEKLQALNANGESHYNIPLSSRYSSFDLVCIDDKTVAITTGYSGVIIIDLNDRKVKRSIDLPTQPFGICFNGNLLICCCHNMDMHVISLKTPALQRFRTLLLLNIRIYHRMQARFSILIRMKIKSIVVYIVVYKFGSSKMNQF